MKAIKIVYIAIVFLLFMNVCSTGDRKGAMELSTKSHEAWNLYQKGFVSGQNGNYYEAMELYENAIQEDPDFFMAFCQKE